ncbi:MAG: serine/threonine protein kinase [Candidatus Limnocylindria bacterium]
MALKVLRTKNAASEPYQRFRQEVAALRALGDHPGILPVIDANLPERPSSKHPAWLAMPLAYPIRQVLEDAPLADVVSAVATIAETLADLQEKHQLSHRDVKPSNLYGREGLWLVGDFGLVELPGQEDITQSDRPLGPVNFIPYEMMVDPSRAAGGPADVYSMAKTAWVLATGQTYPPQGEQPATNRAIGVGQYKAHARAQDLDRILDRATKHDPRDRPSMRTFAADLRAWLVEPPDLRSLPDLAELGLRLRAAAAPRLSDAQQRDRLEELAAAAADRLARLLRPVERRLKDEYSLAQVDAYNRMAENMLKHELYLGSAGLIAEQVRATVLTGPGHLPVELVIGRKVGVTDDGMMRLAGICYVGRQTLGGGSAPWQVEVDPIPADSLQAEQAVDSLAKQIIEGVPEWLELFVARISEP